MYAKLNKAFARAIHPRVQANEAWSWRMSSPGLLTYAIQTHGWGFIPNQVLPPLLANTRSVKFNPLMGVAFNSHASVGAILYTSYLQILGALHKPSSESAKRVCPPPPPNSTFTAGFTAGAIQSVIAAPLDALSVRFRPTDILDGRYKNMWHYAFLKTKDIGIRGVFAGWSLSCIKDSIGYGLFFATFEYVKAQSYLAFITQYYGSRNWQDLQQEDRTRVIRPYYAIEPAFLLLAGVAASIAQQIIQHPIGLMQDVYHRSLASFDRQTRIAKSSKDSFWLYYMTYRRTFEQCRARATQSGGWKRWLYKGFFWNTIKQVPSTSAGLVIFELVRRRYGNDADAVRIRREGYDIILV